MAIGAKGFEPALLGELIQGIQGRVVIAAISAVELQEGRLNIEHVQEVSGRG